MKTVILKVGQNKIITINEYLGSMLPKGSGVCITPVDIDTDILRYEATLHDDNGHFHVPSHINGKKYIAPEFNFTGFTKDGVEYVKLDMTHVNPRSLRHFYQHIVKGIFTGVLYFPFSSYTQDGWEDDCYDDPRDALYPDLTERGGLHSSVLDAIANSKDNADISSSGIDGLNIARVRQDPIHTWVEHPTHTHQLIGAFANIVKGHVDGSVIDTNFPRLDFIAKAEVEDGKLKGGFNPTPCPRPIKMRLPTLTSPDVNYTVDELKESCELGKVYRLNGVSITFAEIANEIFLGKYLTVNDAYKGVKASLVANPDTGGVAIIKVSRFDNGMQS